MTVIEMDKLTIKLPKSLREEITAIAKQRDSDDSKVARAALRQYVAIHKAEDRPA